jgi:hypothetical protein
MLYFNDTTNYLGIVQQVEEETAVDPGTISGNTTKLKRLTAKANLAKQSFAKIAIQASGPWQWDDSNHTDHPIIKTNLVSGQSSYIITQDEQLNNVLDIYKVAILPSATATTYVDVDPTDEQAEDENSGFISETSTGGTPRFYGKTGSAIFLDPTPNYNATNGLKLYINREAFYYVYTDTTRPSGLPSIFDRYIVLWIAEDDARIHSKATYPALRTERMQMELDIKDYFYRREKDVPRRMAMNYINFR